MHRLFPSQQENEKIYLVVREHWFFLFVRLMVIGFLLAALTLFRIYGPGVAPGLFIGTPALVVSVLSQVFVMALVMAVFIIWVLYYLNIQIITNLRVVDVDQKGLFHRRISELHIDKIEDVTSETKGVLGNLLQFGNVFVQTAGTKEHFEFYRVPSPDHVERLILDLYEKREQTDHK